jgi:hypothetical protein
MPTKFGIKIIGRCDIIRQSRLVPEQPTANLSHFSRRGAEISPIEIAPRRSEAQTKRGHGGRLLRREQNALSSGPDSAGLDRIIWSPASR